MIETIIKYVLFFVLALFIISELANSGANLNGGIFSGGTPNDASVAPDTEQIQSRIEEIRSELAQTLAQESPSPYADDITLTQGNARDEDNEDSEYVTIENFGNDGSVDITGWTLKSLATGRSITMPKGTRAKSFSRLGFGRSDVRLDESERAYVISGAPTARHRFEDNANAFLNDDDWIVALHSNSELWNDESDAIMLFDDDGRVVSYAEY